MEKNLIRQWLIAKKPKVYTVIVQVYYSKLSNLKTALFIEWLANELQVPKQSINKASMSSALRRFRAHAVKRENLSKGTSHAKNIDTFNNELPDRISFE
ncbi:MAG: hypothetical protein O9294_11945 [Cytophagales bacterium]|jgi:hypothetical protein|nr:hypothetical protein [Cytophagales bacterium]